MHRLTLIVVQALLIAASATTHATDSLWKEYLIPEYGFRVALPTKPQSRVVPLPSRDGKLRVIESIVTAAAPTKYSIFIGQPEKQGIFESDSMDAYLTAHLKSMVAVAEGGKLISSNRTTFRGHPALEYRFSHRIEGHPYIAQGLTFMIDGGHIRISMWHPATNLNAAGNYKKLLDSFKLIPIQYSPADIPFVEPRGVSFSPPRGWIRQPSQNALQVARYNNLTRSIQLLLAGVHTYSCDNYLSEMQASGRLTSASTVRLGDQQFKKLISFENVPKYNVRLTTVHYCLNSPIGAVVLGAAEEESMYARWERVFEGTALSIKIK